MTEKILVDPAYNTFNAQHQSYKPVTVIEKSAPGKSYSISGFAKKVFGLLMLAGGIYFGIPSVEPLFTGKPKDTYENLEGRILFKSDTDGRMDIRVSREARKLIEEGHLHKQMGDYPMDTYEMYKTYLKMDLNADNDISEEEAQAYKNRMRAKKLAQGSFRKKNPDENYTTVYLFDGRTRFEIPAEYKLAMSNFFEDKARLDYSDRDVLSALTLADMADGKQDCRISAKNIEEKLLR